MNLRSILILSLLLPISLFAQKSTENKAIKIEFLQSLNKLETAFQKDKTAVAPQMENLMQLMDKEIEKNNTRTEALMKMPQRSPEERKTLQDQLALTAKQKYLQKSFAELDWKSAKLDTKMALQVVRNFMEILQ